MVGKLRNCARNMSDASGLKVWQSLHCAGARLPNSWEVLALLAMVTAQMGQRVLAPTLALTGPKPW
eukprot:409910-Amphidinium_carterae.1